MKYAIIKETNCPFTKIHDSYQEAVQEAERLCKKEGVPFILVRLLSRCYVKEAPIQWEEYRE